MDFPVSSSVSKVSDSTSATNHLEQQRQEISRLNQQLAELTLRLAQKHGLLKSLKQELASLKKENHGEPVVRELEKLIRRIHFDENFDEGWDRFSLYFDHVQQDFFKKLFDLFPHLTRRDQQLCAYLRMNMSTKDIASLMNISVRGVEISRYRLRKKLQLPNKENLMVFLENI